MDLVVRILYAQLFTNIPLHYGLHYGAMVYHIWIWRNCLYLYLLS